MFRFGEDNQEVPVMVEDIREAAQRIAANCREARREGSACPLNCPGLMTCALAGAGDHPDPSPLPSRERE